MSRSAPEDPALRALFWRDEILQVMYWLAGEKLADEVTAATLSSFLNEPAHELAFQLARLARDGDLETRSGGRYRLSEAGAAHGRQAFSDDFAGLMGQAHGECSDDCWCHRSSEDAAACLRERSIH